MSGGGAPSLQADAPALPVVVVAASWHDRVMQGLRAGARRSAEASGAHLTEVLVPGSFELPVVAAECAKSGQFEAIVALGVVIRGGTPHFDYVCSAATSGLSRGAIDYNIAVGFGLLTCETEEQALDRAGLDGSSQDKG